MEHSLRLRITPTELQALVEGDSISEAFAASSWQMSVHPSSITSIHFEGSAVTVTISSADVARLASPECEGVYFTAMNHSAIHYFIEKDFPCAHPRPADAGDPITEIFSPPPGFKSRHASA